MGLGSLISALVGEVYLQRVQLHPQFSSFSACEERHARPHFGKSERQLSEWRLSQTAVSACVKGVGWAMHLSPEHQQGCTKFGMVESLDHEEG